MRIKTAIVLFLCLIAAQISVAELPKPESYKTGHPSIDQAIAHYEAFYRAHKAQPYKYFKGAINVGLQDVEAAARGAGWTDAATEELIQNLRRQQSKINLDGVGKGYTDAIDAYRFQNEMALPPSISPPKQTGEVAKASIAPTSQGERASAPRESCVTVAKAFLNALMIPEKPQMVHVRDAFSQGPVAPLISSKYIQEYSHVRGHHSDPIFNKSDDDHMKYVMRIPGEGVSALPSAGKAAAIGMSQSALGLAGAASNLPVLRNGHAVAETGALRAVSPAVNPPVNPKDELRIVRQHVENEMGDLLDEGTKELAVKTIMNDPEQKNLVLSRHVEAVQAAHASSALANRQPASASPAFTAAKTFTLENVGKNRYFWFVPREQTNPAQLSPARVLDLHPNRSQGGMHLLAEWLMEGPNGDWERHVGMLTPSEFEKIARFDDAGRAEAFHEFQDMLSPNQIRTKELAKNLNIPLKSYSDFRRAPGVNQGDDKTLMGSSAVLSHMAIRSSVLKRFGSVDDLMTPAERNHVNWNIVDVMSRLSPKEVMTRFRASGEPFKYMWAITEDGQLHIVPIGPEEANVKPLITRIAKGKKLFASGIMRAGHGNDVDVTLKAGDYWSTAFDTSDTNLFGTTDDMKKFVASTFHLQAGQRLNRFNEEPVDTFARYEFRRRGDGFWDEVGPIPASGGHAGTHHPGAGGRSHEDDAESFFNSVAKDMKKDAPRYKDLTWERKDPKAKPLSQDEWMAQSGRTSARHVDAHTQEEYAHYVLGTTSNMPLKDIKKAHQKLAALFHPKATSDSSEASSMINAAYTLLKAKYASK
jgi:hypothetical protein